MHIRNSLVELPIIGVAMKWREICCCFEIANYLDSTGSAIEKSAPVLFPQGMPQVREEGKECTILGIVYP